MKNTRLFLPLLIAATLAGSLDSAFAANTDATVTYTVTTQNYNGDYDPRNIAVVWVVNSDGNFVKTLCRHANARIQYLAQWIASRGSYTVVDGVTSATLTSQPQTHPVTWDCRGTNGLVVADGTYYFRAEYTSSNGQGPYLATACSFVKGAAAISTNYPNFSNAAGQFTGMSLTYTPKADVAVTALEPCCGMINTNMVVQVAVTNLTLNPATFTVAVSNVTAGALIGTQPVTALAGNAQTNLFFPWNTTGLSASIYSVRAVASTLANETVITNNTFTRNVNLSPITSSDVEVTALTTSSGIRDFLVPLTVAISNTSATATGPFLVALTNLTGSTLVSASNTWQIATGSDDAEENAASHTVSITSTDMELVTDGSAVQIVGLRFPNLGIPAGATISSAAIQFIGRLDDTLNQNPVSLTLRGQAADSPATFAATASNIINRPDTAASVNWVPPNWANGETGANARTPELKTVVQEIVDRPGWASGNAMVFKITGTGGRRAWSYNGSAGNAARLTVQWTASSPQIATHLVSDLAGLAGTNLVVTWNTAGLTAGVYQVQAVLGVTAAEIDLDDNTLVAGIALRDPFHDLAVHSLAITPMVPPNVSTNIVVTVTNAGDYAESFTHTLRDITAAPITIGSTPVNNLAANARTNLVYAWNTAMNAGFALGIHTLQAGVTLVPGEAETANNTNQLQVIVASGMATNTLVAKNAVWKVLDQGLDVSAAPWQLDTYYDGFWGSGAAPLGYGLPNIATAIGYGGVSSNRFVTTYFRREFTMDFPPTSLAGSLMRTHGAVLYLNGMEIARQNMPPGPVDYTTFASNTVSGSAATNYFSFVVPPEALRVGRNLLAAELHLAASTNTTAGFSLELTSVNPAIPLLPSVAATALEPEGTIQSGDLLGVSVELLNTGNTATSSLLLLRDATTGAVLVSQAIAALAPGESTLVRLAWPTFGATTGGRTLQAVTVINGVTNLAGAATAPLTLAALNFSPRTVNAAGSIGGRCSAVAVVGSTVYLGCGATLEVWDATVPAAPVRVGSLRLPGIIEDLAASNTWVYAATGVAGVQIVDAAAATQLVHRATFDTSGFARRVALQGNLLYVADSVTGIRVLNVADPAAPTLAGAYHTTGPAQTVTPTPPRLLVLDVQRGLLNLHAADPAAMSVTGSVSRVSAGLALTAVSGAATAADANGGLFRISTADPAMPTITTNTLLPAAGRSLATSGGALYAAAGAAGLVTLDATTLALQSTTPVGDEAYDVAVAGSTLYVAAGFAGCRSFTLASPLAPAPLGLYATGARAVDAAASGSTLVTAADEGGLQVHRLQDMALPTRMASVSSLTNSRCVEIAYPLAYVGDGLFGLKVFNIANAAAPVLVGTYPATGLSHIRRIALAGSRAVLTDGRALQLLSVANPAAPSLLATVTNIPGSFVFDVAAVSNQAYAACGRAGLRIYGLDNGLTLDNTYATPGPATGVASVSNLLYVACGPYGWLILSIAANPVSPALVKDSAAGMMAFGASAAGPLLYLTDGARVGQALNVSAPLTPLAVTNFLSLTQALRVRAVKGLMLAAEDEAGLAILNASPGDINLSGIPDTWEQQIVTASVATNGPVRSVLDVDPLAVGPNGFPYYQSYLAGLSPTDPNSVLAISAASALPAGGAFVVQWLSVPGIKYVVHKSTNLTDSAAGFMPISPAITATAALTSYTNAVDSTQAFYMIITTP